MLFALEGFAVNLVRHFSTGRTRGEPTVLGRDLETADLRAVTRRLRQTRDNLIPGEGFRRDLLGRHLLERRLHRKGRGSFHSLVEGGAEALREIRVILTRFATRLRDDFRREEIENQPVLIGRPDGAVEA